jgi:poly-gamma-glutamate synthesis protein (capsule biosynthesis protein)
MAYLELQKISFAPDSAVTTIDSAGYYLEWVYRTVDKDKDYYILPVGKVENDSISFIKDAASRAAYKTFVEDSRGLYRQHNVEVQERAKLPVRYEAKLPDDDR